MRVMSEYKCSATLPCANAQKLRERITELQQANEALEAAIERIDTARILEDGMGKQTGEEIDEAVALLPPTD